MAEKRRPAASPSQQRATGAPSTGVIQHTPAGTRANTFHTPALRPAP